MNWIKQNPALAGIGALIGAGVVAFLAFGVFGIHTAFVDDKVDEAIPVFESGAVSDIESDMVDEATTADMNEVMQDEQIPAEVEADEPMPDMEGEPQAEAAPVITTVVEGQFVPRSHPGSGVAKVITDGSMQRFLRFEDFETDNGPDLFVYLTSADAAADSSEFGADGQFVNLGRLKGNIGEQNYEIDPSVDLGVFDTVVVWCDRFSVAFTAADLT